MDQHPSKSRIVSTNGNPGLTAFYSILPPAPSVSFTEGLLFGLPAAAIMALPIALRLNGSLAQLVMVYLGALGLHGMLLGLTAGTLRVCRPLPSRSPAFALGVVLSVFPLARLGSVLYAGTHHRPLGAATFAVLALLVVLGYWAVTARALGALRSVRPYRRWYGRLLLGGLVLISLGVGMGPLLTWLGSLGHSPLHRSGLIDGLLGASLVGVGGFVRFPIRVELAARMAGPMAFVVCVLALLVGLRGDVAAVALCRVSALWALLS
jgi:hypothetical protein